MPTASRLARTATALFLAVACCPVALGGPRGPTPGETPATHAAAYAQAQAAAAAADPAGYAQQKATPEGVSGTVEEAGYTACWAAYDETEADLAPCDAYFTPPGKAARPSRPQAAAPEQVAEAEEQVGNLTAAAFDAVNGTLADPASAPSQIQQAADAVLAFLAWVAGAVADLVRSIVDGLAAAGAAALDGLRAAVDGLSAGFSAGVSAVGDGASAAGSAVSDAAGAVAQAVGAAVDAVADAVTSLFGGAHASAPAAPSVQAPVALPDADPAGLLDGVASRLPAAV